jgi:myo-inositol-1(or 4)-monophosphatase
MHPMLNIAVKAARRALAPITRAALEGGLELRAKTRNAVVTQVAKAAETAIIDIIRRAYPEHAFLAEESGASAGARPEFLWVIDPLDGTTNYIHGFPQYCVSGALEHKGVLTQAVVYDPGKNELFTASRGRGAFLDDRRIRVSKCTQLADALVGTGFPFKELERIDLYMRQLRTLMGSCAGVRRAGAAALDLAYVAAWRLDAFWEMGLSRWDMAAGALLIQEAGGLVSDLDGKAGYLDSGDIAAATPKVLPQLLSALK